MRILIITPYFAPAWAYGGPPRILYEMAKQLLRQGHQVSVITTNVHDAFSVQPNRHLDLEGIDVTYLPTISNKLSYYTKLIFPIGFRKELIARAANFDVALLGDARTYMNGIAYKILKSFFIPYVHVAYGSLPIVGSLSKKLMKKVFDFLWTAGMLHDASGLLAQTQHEKREYEKWVGKDSQKIHILPLAVDAERFQEETADIAFLNKKYELEDYHKVVLSLGRIHKLKITPLMVDVMADIIKQDKSIIWILIGRDDGYLNIIQDLIRMKKIEKNFIFLGPLYDKEKIALYHRAHCFFLAPSHYEETSTASLEALACGTPCVLTEQCDVPFLQKYDAGWICRYDNQDLYNALVDVLNRPKEYYQSRCQKLIHSHFTWEKVGEQLEAILNKCMVKNAE